MLQEGWARQSIGFRKTDFRAGHDAGNGEAPGGDDRHLLGAQRNAGMPVMWCPITRVCTSSVPS